MVIDDGTVEALAQILSLGRLELVGPMPPARESTAWLVTHASGLAVLRRSYPCHPSRSTSRDVVWLHDFLLRLGDTGFPAPRPVLAFDGRSWVSHAGADWQLVSYLPGEAIGWNRRPRLDEVGALLAVYHEASGSLRMVAQRPSALPIGDLGRIGVIGEAGDWLDALTDDLDRIGHRDALKLVIHGDCTTHNVVASGDPLKPSGIIDFALAYVDAPLADVGFGLWRSGRSHQDAIALDQRRVKQVVAGYFQTGSRPPNAAVAITVYIRARGLQQLVKCHRKRRPAPPLLHDRIRWLITNDRFLQDAIGEL